MEKSYRFKFLESKAFDSRVTSANVKNGERWLGYFMAPALVACMAAICGQSYLNVFYTDILKMSPIAGGLFLALMPLISKIVDAITNVIMGRMIDRTQSARGKARPWLLISGPLMAISAFLLFAAPESNSTLQIVWVTMTYNLYFCISYTMYNISNVLMVPLSTRNSKQRDTLAMASSMGINMVPGMLVSILFPMIFLPYMGVDKSKWLLVMTIIGLLAIPATLLQYFFTRERVTEEAAESTAEKQTHSLREQLRGCFKSQYWIVIIGIIILFQLYTSFSVTSTLYYSNWVLGTYNDGITMTLINAVGQFLLGIGVVALWPLVKKYGKRNMMIIGSVISIIGGIICTLSARSMGGVLGGLVIRSIGSLPITYTILAMLADALDHVEWLNGFRCDGFSSSVYSIVMTVIAGISMGVFNLMLGRTGYVAPAADGSWIAQSAAVQNLFIVGMFVVPAVGTFLVAFLLGFFNVEKDLPKMQAEIVARHRAEAEARGEVYISPAEKAQQEQDALDRVAEEKRIEELKARCAKKGLSFEAEEAKYQEKLAVALAKAEAKLAKKK